MQSMLQSVANSAYQDYVISQQTSTHSDIDGSNPLVLVGASVPSCRMADMHFESTCMR